MKTSDGGLYFGSGIETEQIQRDAEKIKREFRNIGQSAVNETSRMDGLFKNVLAGAAGALTLQAAMSFRSKLIEVRGEFQKYEAVLTNSLGSQQEAAESMKMLSDVASKTPFQLNNLTSSYVKLVNQGFKPTRIELIKMGDLASSTGKDFDQLVEAILDAQTGQYERLKEFGIKASQSGDQVSFSFKGVTTTVKNSGEAIRAYMLSLGDMQGVKGSMEAISKTLVGQVSNLEDKITAMFNNIGTSSEGLLSDSISGASLLVDNYAEIAKVIEVLIATYGAYKAAVIVTTAVEAAATLATKGWTVAEVLHFNAMKLAAAAQSILNKTMLANPYVAVATALAGLITYLILFKKETNEITEAQKEFKESSSKSVAEVTALFDQLKKTNVGTDERKRVIEQLNSKYGEYLGNMNLEKAALNDIEKAQNAVSNAMLTRMANEGKTKDLSSITERKLATLRAIQTSTSKSDFDEISKYIEEASKPATFTADKSGKLKPNFVFKSWGNEIDGLIESLHVLKQQEDQVNKTWDNLLSTLQQPVNTTINQAKKTEDNKEKQTFDEFINYKKKKYEEYYTWARALGISSADNEFKDLISGAKTYEDFLKNSIDKIEAKKGAITENEKQRLSTLKKYYSDVLIEKAKVEMESIQPRPAGPVSLSSGTQSGMTATEMVSNHELDVISENSKHILEFSAKTLQEFMKDVAVKIQLLKSEGKSVTELEIIYNQAAVALNNLTKPDRLKNLDQWQEAFRKISFYASGAIDLLRAMSKEEGDAASSAANSIGAVMDIANSTLQGLATGGIIGGAVAFAMSTATKVFEAQKSHEQALQKISAAKLDTQKEYNDLLLQQNELLEKARTIFGTDAFGEAKAAVDKYIKYLAANKKALQGLESASVVTGSHKTGLFGWGGEVADYSSLLKIYPKLIDSQGMLNKELAQSILDNQQLDETSRQALQSAIEYSDGYKGALDELSSYMSTVFGSLGNDMMTAITDNLGSSKDALNDFADYAAGAIEKLMSDIAYSMFFADIFADLSKQVLDISKNATLTDSAKASAEMEAVGNFFAGLGDETNAANQFLQNVKNQSSKYGFDLWNKSDSNGSSQSAASTGSFQSMSQDTGNALEGRFTALQMISANIERSITLIQPDISVIRVNSQITAESLKESRNIALESMNHLADINKNTKQLYDTNEKLDKIIKNTSGL
jgi:hypothetical protein